MGKILSTKEALRISKDLRKDGKTIVLAGGVFDILHKGHFAFLEKAKDCADFLFLMVESDKKVKALKGENRPINTQAKRAKALSKVPLIDFVVKLPYFKRNEDYDSFVVGIKPDIIAATKGDPFIFHKKRQAKKINSKVVEVLDRITNISTTEIIKK